VVGKERHVIWCVLSRSTRRRQGEKRGVVGWESGRNMRRRKSPGTSLSQLFPSEITNGIHHHENVHTPPPHTRTTTRTMRSHCQAPRTCVGHIRTPVHPVIKLQAPLQKQCALPEKASQSSLAVFCCVLVDFSLSTACILVLASGVTKTWSRLRQEGAEPFWKAKVIQGPTVAASLSHLGSTPAEAQPWLVLCLGVATLSNLIFKVVTLRCEPLDRT
jgi:hypothetical protein